MPLFNSFNTDIINGINTVNSDLARLIKEFNKSLNYFKQKTKYLALFLEYEHQNKIKKFPQLIKQFRNYILEDLSIERKEELTNKKLVSEVKNIIKSKIDQDDLARFKSIEKELKIFLEDLIKWKEIILKQNKFLEKNKDRIFFEHQYVIRHISVLLEQEKEIIYKHVSFDKPAEKELVDDLSKKINSIMELWRPDFINSLSTKEITGPDDPDLVELYNDVFKGCFPLDLMPLEDFQQVLEESNEGELDDGRYHIIVIKNKKGKIIAGQSFYFLVDEEDTGIAFGIDEYIGVLPEYRRYSIASTIVTLRLKALNKDAKRMGLRHVSAILGEYHNEKKMTKKMIEQEGFNPVERKKFWQKMHMDGLRFDYKNPQLDDMRKIEEVYTLGFWSVLKQHKHRVDSKFLYKVLENWFIYGYGIHINHHLIRHIRKILSKRPYVEIDSLVP